MLGPTLVVRAGGGDGFLIPVASADEHLYPPKREIQKGVTSDLLAGPLGQSLIWWPRIVPGTMKHNLRLGSRAHPA